MVETSVAPNEPSRPLQGEHVRTGERVMLSYLIEATLRGALVYAPVAPVAWLSLAIGIASRLGGDVPLQRRDALAFIPLLLTVLLIGYGSAFAVEQGHPPPFRRQMIILCILGGQAVVSGFILRLLPGRRIAAFGVLVFEGCLSAVAGLEAAMSVTNRWL